MRDNINYIYWWNSRNIPINVLFQHLNMTLLFLLAPPRCVDDVIYITYLFVNIIMAVIPGLQRSARNRQNSKYLVSSLISLPGIFIITKFRFALSWFEIGLSSFTGFWQSVFEIRNVLKQVQRPIIIREKFLFEKFQRSNTSSYGLKPRDSYTDSLTANNSKWIPSSQSFSVWKQ